MSVVVPLPPIPESRRKGGGNVGDAFSSISTVTTTLPAKYSALKQEITAGHEKAILESWLRLLHRLETVTLPEIAEHGSSLIPEVQYADVEANGHEIPAAAAALLKQRGIIIVRGLFDPKLALDWKQQIRDYVRANPSTTGFPKDDIQVFELYWSPAQVAARSHPNMLKIQRALNRVWSSAPEDKVVLQEPLSYVDRVRIRNPADKAWSLGPHVDGGSLERWEDPQYRKCYSKILQGDWENHDAFDVSPRIEAEYDLHYGPGGCSIFRTYQGWTSMSDCAPGEGTLQVLPDLLATTAYTLLRPLVKYNAEGKWEAESSSPIFHGAEVGAGQEFNEADHPHFRPKVFVSIPAVHPGDAVFWHCDLAHMVESEHKGVHDSSVLYIPVVPLCEQNIDYIRTQSAAFLNGTPPTDFPGGVGESKHVGRAGIDSIHPEGLRAMGLARFTPDSTSSPAQLEAYEYANKTILV